MAEPPPPACTAARLFEIVWETMADVIGTAATATLMRRSAKRVSVGGSELVVVTRHGFDYRYSLPERWQQAEGEAVGELRQIARQLSPLLIELTGPVLLRRLIAHDDLQRCRILFEERPE